MLLIIYFILGVKEWRGVILILRVVCILEKLYLFWEEVEFGEEEINWVCYRIVCCLYFFKVWKYFDGK